MYGQRAGLPQLPVLTIVTICKANAKIGLARFVRVGLSFIMISMLINWLKRSKALFDIVKNRLAPLGYEDNLGFHYQEFLKTTELSKRKN